MTKAEVKACCVPQPTARGQPDIQRKDAVPCQGLLDHGLVALQGGTFTMGADDGPYPHDGEGPQRRVKLDAFWIAPLTVTNSQFQAFVQETGYTTLAEHNGKSFVFKELLPKGASSGSVAVQAPWWYEILGACWHLPEGPQGAGIDQRSDHPVVHIALPDALAYCSWAGVCLPSEAQWEYAARGGLEMQPYPWGRTLEPDGQHMSNVWQGRFPNENTAEDGFFGTAPARCYAPNGYGLYAMTGNIWEWTNDRFTALHSPRAQTNPKGPLNGDRAVAKGGSYLCHASYCYRYRTSSRQALDPYTTAGNLGFRVAATT
ncbi:formylglycine-generating enzyme family protein [uncultured Sulfitobacter sp.]|uniref:formylglycine-generating enzyme family protein n=1 Tax=uncultured Sulfitobacter sp. TaxID=191468 RepID=UPI002602A760|nr:formylglycine-generating enzyme family protein [uncultured Sulfitobacter sp.]